MSLRPFPAQCSGRGAEAQDWLAGWGAKEVMLMSFKFRMKMFIAEQNLRQLSPVGRGRRYRRLSLAFLHVCFFFACGAAAGPSEQALRPGQGRVWTRRGASHSPGERPEPPRVSVGPTLMGRAWGMRARGCDPVCVQRDVCVACGSPCDFCVSHDCEGHPCVRQGVDVCVCVCTHTHVWS